MKLPFSFLAVELVRGGMSTKGAALMAIQRIAAHYPEFSGALVVASIDGDVGQYIIVMCSAYTSFVLSSLGAACHGFQSFSYSLRSADSVGVEIIHVDC
jgi:hypothetical protein